MADVNYLQEVKSGEKIKASVTNSNNNYLDNKIDTTNKNLTEIIAGIKTSLESQIETNNTNLINSINNVNSGVNSVKNSLKFSYTSNGLGLSGGVQTSLKSVLPSDGKIYLVWVQVLLGGNNATNCYVQTDIFYDSPIASLDGDSGRSSRAYNTVCVPVGTGRWIRMTQGGNLRGYMKVG